jgi:hypothetical protein
MDPVSIAESVKKHGVTGLLCICLFWMNTRLSDVEERLYDCLDERATAKSTPIGSKKQYNRENMVAVLPDKLKIEWQS